MTNLDLETMKAAINGEEEAIEQVLKEYEAYITEIATLRITDSIGQAQGIVSEDMKQEIREKLVLELPKIRGIKK